MTQKWIHRFMLATPLALALVGITPAMNATSLPKDSPGITQQEVRNFAEFLNRHAMINQQLQRRPGLANNPSYLARHPELQTFLNDHPAVRKEVNTNARALMRKERGM